MAKDPALHQTVGYKDLDGNAYQLADQRLAGMGNPPADPAFARDNPGMGRLVMEKKLVEVEEIAEEHRPAEEKWIQVREPEPAPEPA